MHAHFGCVRGRASGSVVQRAPPSTSPLRPTSPPPSPGTTSSPFRPLSSPRAPRTTLWIPGSTSHRHRHPPRPRIAARSPRIFTRTRPTLPTRCSASYNHRGRRGKKKKTSTSCGSMLSRCTRRKLGTNIALPKTSARVKLTIETIGLTRCRRTTSQSAAPEARTAEPQSTSRRIRTPTIVK